MSPAFCPSAAFLPSPPPSPTAQTTRVASPSAKNSRIPLTSSIYRPRCRTKLSPEPAGVDGRPSISPVEQVLTAAAPRDRRCPAVLITRGSMATHESDFCVASIREHTCRIKWMKIYDPLSPPLPVSIPYRFYSGDCERCKISTGLNFRPGPKTFLPIARLRPNSTTENSLSTSKSEKRRPRFIWWSGSVYLAKSVLYGQRRPRNGVIQSGAARSDVSGVVVCPAEEQDCAPLFYEWRFIAPKPVPVPSRVIPSFFLYVFIRFSRLEGF